MKVLVDMNLSPAWLDTLGHAGFQAMHWSKVGDARAPDRAILDWASRNDCVLLTNDLDFGAILAARGWASPSVLHGERPSLVYDPSPFG